MQLIGLLVAFALIILLVSRRVNVALALSAGTTVLALTSMMSPAELLTTVVRGLTAAGTVELVLDVAVITSLAGVLKRYALLEEMVASLTALLGGLRLAVMAVPSLIGALPVLGGAILSAPMVDGLGDRLGLGPARKAAVNLVFRHAWFYAAPFTPALVLASRLSGVPLGRLMLVQVPFAAVMLVGGYFFLLRKASVASAGTGEAAGTDPEVPEPATAGTVPATASHPHGTGRDIELDRRAARRLALGRFLRSSSPIIVGVFLSVGVAGVTVPLYAGIGCGLAVALFLSRGHKDFRLLGLEGAWAGIQWGTVLAMAVIMVFAEIMRAGGLTQELIASLLRSGLPAWALMVALPMVIGFISGVPSVPVGVSFPALMPLAEPGHAAVAAAVLYVSGFVAYFASPMHLCQILSSQYFGVSLSRVYREYWPVIASLVALVAAYAWYVSR